MQEARDPEHMRQVLDARVSAKTGNQRLLGRRKLVELFVKNQPVNVPFSRAGLHVAARLSVCVQHRFQRSAVEVAVVGTSLNDIFSGPAALRTFTNNAITAVHHEKNACSTLVKCNELVSSSLKCP